MKRYVAVRPYRPSNGTEGDLFEAKWCGTCARNKVAGCAIRPASVCCGVEDERYPEEWVEDANDQSPFGPSFSARCTAHVCAMPGAVAAVLGVDPRTGQSLRAGGVASRGG